MSTEIVSDICSPPEWDLAEEDIHQMADELARFYDEWSYPANVSVIPSGWEAIKRQHENCGRTTKTG